MELATHNITWSSRRNHQPIVIAPIGDIQWSGKRGSTAGDILKRHIDKCMKLGAWFVGLGDYTDFMSPSNRQRFKAAALYDCVSVDTRILTKFGWKFYSQLLIGEDILGYDLVTRKAVWTPLRKVVTWEHAPVVNVKARGWSWRVTDNHRWVVQHIDGHQSMMPTYALRQGIHRIVTAGVCDESGDADLSPDEAALLGWILTDGHVKFPECWTTYLSQTKRKYVEDIRRLLARLPWLKVAETENEQTGYGAGKGTWIRWGFSAPEIRGLFARAGASVEGDIPRISMCLSVEARRAMLDAMLHAEGHREFSKGRGSDHGGWQFTQKDPLRLDLFYALCALLGVPTRHRSIDVDGITRTGTRSSALRWVHGQAWARSVERIVAHETVWCPVTDTGTWMGCYEGQTSFTGNSAEDVVDDAALELVHELYEDYLKPTKGRWLGLCHGHHWAQLRTGDTTDMRLCQMLDAKFLGTCAYIRLVFRSNGSRFSIVLFVHHGCGGGMKMSAPLNKIENLLPYWDADVFLLGHMTKQAAAPVNRIMPRWHGFGSPDLVHRKVYMVGCGGFSKSYVEGAKQGQIPMGNYVEQRLLSPASLGAPLIKIVPVVKYRRYGPRKDGRGSATWEPDVTVEL